VLLGNILLALAWAALQGEFSLATLVTGHVLGYLILLALVRGGVLGTSPYIGRVHRVVGLVTYFLWELLRANLRIALDVATPRYHMKPGIIAVPLDVTHSEILLLSMLINTTPGSVALDVSPDRKLLYVHIMYEHARCGAGRNQDGVRTPGPRGSWLISAMGPLTTPSGVALTMLAAAACLTFVRLLKGPTLPDRVVAIDLIGVLMVSILVVTAAATAQQAFLDVGMVVALISFVGTVAYSRYIERSR
jgi:multicomponent Na+:H+ antiporter subunit E